ncbi:MULTISPECIES: succinic semialdehyde dehydrogenase [Halolamina]|uniref:Succinate-semialdehyde dehydrogenase / glutarate-semialdehyde dehydrogenase n=1 Tax=Halolamina pelagica TaxID=699431 RepID=A0A1I5UK66_9EURY|nr:MULTISPECIES: succinic semialdehyde dehydrogenase [Halolamina]NHX37580.1 succinate-semialdehyde dehydrogenase (NADP(+)) [Halolamina sp. R1-12]SFP95664.1 succinate-semialdehyde dehydrogenase / glutarate-semialdehyde dehydrogenase [Halolamina pelagica]
MHNSPVGRDRLESLRDALVVTGERERLDVIAPVSGAPFTSIPAGTEADVEVAVERAEAAQASWAGRPLTERAAVLERYADRVLDAQDELLDVAQLETGKTRRDAFEEVLDVVQTATHYADAGPELLESERRSGAIPGLTKTTVHRRPKGVAGFISPWNYPVTLSVSDALPALLAGNAVVLKPAQETTHTALLARQLLVDAGLPPAAFQVVSGTGERVGAELVDRVDYVCFTGSTEAGRSVAKRAGRALIDCSLELGGKNPLLVLDDANPRKAARGAIRACFPNAGQLCISTERLYIHESVYEAFRDAFVTEARALDLGTGFAYGPDVGSLQSAAQLDKTERHVADAIEKGADVLVGGRPRPDVGPYFYEPTVLTDVTHEMTLFDEETFGPVVSLYPVGSVDDAVERANDSRYGLNASVWTGDHDRGERVAERIDCGTVNVNEAYAAAWASVDAPMGGMGDSGIGRRHGEEGLLKYTEAQTVAVQRGLQIGPGPLPDGVWARLMTGFSKLLKRLPGWLR